MIFQRDCSRDSKKFRCCVLIHLNSILSFIPSWKLLSFPHSLSIEMSLHVLYGPHIVQSEHDMIIYHISILFTYGDVHTRKHQVELYVFVYLFERDKRTILRNFYCIACYKCMFHWMFYIQQFHPNTYTHICQNPYPYARREVSILVLVFLLLLLFLFFWNTINNCDSLKYAIVSNMILTAI